jgi:hypothetical protein
MPVLLCFYLTADIVLREQYYFPEDQLQLAKYAVAV